MSHKILTGSFSSGLTCVWVFLPYPQETTLFSPHLDKKSWDIKTRKPTIKSSSFISKPENFSTEDRQRGEVEFGMKPLTIRLATQCDFKTCLHFTTALLRVFILYHTCSYLHRRPPNWLRKQKYIFLVNRAFSIASAFISTQTQNSATEHKSDQL